jgi:hypothetical protein
MTHAESTGVHQPPTPLLSVEPGASQRHDNLTIFPLISGVQPDLPYLLLGDAIASGVVSIGELGSGSVPSLVASNKGEVDVLIFDGEQLIGAKQNRITNRTIILETITETVIPVSCMEQGRWHQVSDEFRSRPKPRHAPSRVRRKAREVEAALAGSPMQASASVLHQAQSAVWHEIREVGVSMGVSSDTGAMDEIYDRHTQSLDEWIAHFPIEDGQVGLLAFLGNRPLGMDVVGSGSLYARLHERFLGGYCMDALAARRGRTQRNGGPSPAAAARFLSKVGSATRGKAPTVGAGTYQLLSGAAIGAELSAVVDHTERLVHVSAFPGERSRGPGHGPASSPADTNPIASPSRRRGWARERGADES